MEREQFTFYASFARAIQRIRKPAERAAAYDVIIEYALNGTLPDLDKLPDVVGLVFDLIKPNLDASRRKAEGGKKGRPEKDTEKIEERSEEETGNKKEDKKEGEKKDKKEKENKCSLSPLTPLRRYEMIQKGLPRDSGQLVTATVEWVQYKIERREPYKETGLVNLVRQIRKAAEIHGDDAVIDVIQRSMSANYQGIVFDWLERKPEKPKKTVTAAEYKPPEKPKSLDDVYALVDRI